MPSGQKCTVAEMIGELLRDSAVLVAVFAPLESIIKGNPLTFWQLVVTVALVLGLGILGIAIEVKRV
jgi:hypothetical protein